MSSTSAKSMHAYWEDSYLNGGNSDYFEELYETYLANPQALTDEWRHFFDNLNLNDAHAAADVSHAAIIKEFLNLKTTAAAAKSANRHDRLQESVTNLINAYRTLGHLRAKIDPLDLTPPPLVKALELEQYGLSANDLKNVFSVGTFSAIQSSTASLDQITTALKQVYCHSIGFEFMHINRAEEVSWIRERIERGWINFSPSVAEKKRILDRLIVADGLEKYIGFKYVGQKRFSLEGGDALIPMLDTIINRGAENGVKETVIGMAHRGRLNALVNVVGKNPAEIFAAFEGKGVSETNSGDVKYHLGYSSDVKTSHGPMHVTMAFNPSHLEIVSPVVQGSVRARQRRRSDKDQRQAVPIQIHGDAAFAGQGVVMETFNMSQARWFAVGGSIHIVINNQVGFTTSNPKDARSTTYCTDIAKMVEAPILHVNGNDPEAVYYAALFAIDYRLAFKRDVVIDLVCYRRHGHNEADEPSATQPLMYKVIKAMPPPFQLYAEQLIKEKVVDEASVKQMTDGYRQALDDNKSVLDTVSSDANYAYSVNWEKYLGKHWTDPVDTRLPMAELKKIAQTLEVLPDGFTLQAQVKKMLDARKQMTQGEAPINWGYAEVLAYATLLDQGYPIRLCGQDSGRGTFAHRHAVLHDQATDEIYLPLSHVSPTQAQINIVDSLLSEEAVLAFEYGYASAEPSNLVLWEGQFGDFANGAQVVIDQFISSGEQKWGRLCGLVMLLPHGYEGQGPEHSSARLERYLQLCAQENMQVCMPSTPAQMYHLLRRQMIRVYRKPLIVMTPKSMLRNPDVTSTFEDLADGTFQVVIPEVDELPADKITSVIFCSGKVYYDLRNKRRDAKLNTAAIVRIEQLYPFPSEAVKNTLSMYKNARDIVWCQEEPQNQGAWLAIQPELVEILNQDQPLRYAGRASSASPAVGYLSVHAKQQENLILQALQK